MPHMELIEIDDTRVVHLVNMRRRSGQAYWPEVAAKLVARYSFIRYPSIQDLTEHREFMAFGVGKFADSQIQELKVYGDGLVVNARSNSNILDALLDDLLEWASTELGFEPLPNSVPERHHESALVLRAKKDIATVVGPLQELTTILNELLGKENFVARRFQASGFILSSDPQAQGSRRIESRFLIDRRVGVPFAENIFYSQAPLPTDDHLALLERVEDMAA